MTTRLLDNVSVDTFGNGFNTDGAGKTVSIWGASFGGGSVTLQSSPDNGTTWITLTIGGNPAIFTSNAVRYIDRLGQGLLIRATLTGSSGASGISAILSD